MSWKITVPLWSHQESAAIRGASRVGTLLDMEMGTGKTLTAIEVARQTKAKTLLITCPLSVVGIWEAELRERTDAEWVIARCDEGGVKKKTDLAKKMLELAVARQDPCAVIVNHESLWRVPFSGLCASRLWDMLVVDECHRAKAPGGKLSRFLGSVAKNFKLRLGLTGTPLPHSPMDAYAQYRFLDPRVYGTSFNRFKLRYAVLGGYGGYEVVGYQNMDEFRRRFSSISYKVTKAEALDLPPELDERLEVELEPSAQATYTSLEKDFWAAVEGGEITAANALTRLLRLQQITSGWAPTDDGGGAQISTAKRGLLKEAIEDCIVPGAGLARPIVVFARFRKDLGVVHEVAEELNLRSGEVSGVRKDLTSSGTFPENVDVLAVQIQAGGVGINLSKSSVAIFYSMGFSLGDYMQARSRLHRPGQHHPVTFLHLICKNTIDASVIGALRSRKEVIDSILSGRPITRKGKKR